MGLFDTIPRADGRRAPTKGETACRSCTAAACFFLGLGPKPEAWCWACVPAGFLPKARENG